MSRLLVAEQISRAADIEIVARELKPRPEIIQIGQHLEPLFGAFGHQPVGGGGEIGVSACLGAADAATKLVELRHAEAVGAIDDHRVGGRDIEPAFDDRGRDEHRSEEHTSELQSLMRLSFAVFCLKKKK